ncbi:MAG TPA: hypothetical protein VFH70_13755 [Acidimicrobiales bacterium]|nr:hypothetical protein [Acidimicrobiales bacterium]
MNYRLLKVLVQPVLVKEDEDGNLVEVSADVVTVTAPEWRDYSAKLLADLDTFNANQAAKAEAEELAEDQ